VFRPLLVVLAIVAVAVVAPARSAAAADFHHVHLNVTKPVEAAKWYAENLGGEAKKVGFFNAVGFGKTVIIFFQAKPGFPPSDGSAVDHIGFSYKDIHAKMKELEAGGVEIVSGVEQEGPIQYAFVRDPWGTLIEVVEDPEIQGFHHVHLAVTDPRAALAWYTSAFGGQVTRFAGILPGVRYGDMWVLVKKVAEPAAATKGRSIDHISWAFADLDEAAVELKAGGVNFESEPFTFGTSRIAFVIDPSGVRIELVGPAKKK
jgi:catechol 2,3-dioxygenase-like lactoylglutathione lyase family enzyme